MKYIAALVKLRPVLHIIRWPNLLLVVIIQTLVYYKLLYYTQSAISALDLLLLISITLLLTASGFVINDYYDTRPDSVNRPDSRIAGRVISLSSVRALYVLLVVAGAVLALWTAIRLHLLSWLFLYPAAVVGLWLYSYRLKCAPVIGNVWVALFGAGMIGILAVPDVIAKSLGVIRAELAWYILFAFLCTWYREIIKDIEDVRGDARSACRTYVVISGETSGKRLATLIGVLLIAALLCWNVSQTHSLIDWLLVILSVMVLASMVWLWRASDPQALHRVSWMVKSIMLGGVLIVLCL